MTKKTVVVAGAGPGLGAAVARRFGREGFRAALISRKPSTFEPIVADLEARGIEAAGFVGDLTDDESARAAIAKVRERFGRIDVLEYSPIVADHDMATFAVANMTADVVRSLIPMTTYGAITCAHEVLDEMLARKEGTIIITTAGAASLTVPSHAAIGAAFAAARQYAICLNAATRLSGVFVGTVSLAVDLIPGSPVGDPDKVADAYWRMHVERDPVEVKIIDPKLMDVLDKRLAGIQAKLAGEA